MGPAFHPPIAQRIRNFLSGEDFSLVSLDDSFRAGEQEHAKIASICNQPLIYELLFRERWAGRRYTIDDARQFIEWAQQGWRSGSHFVFLILDGQGLVAGAVDIKSPALEAAEIGYWATMHRPGAMTNAVRCVVRLAREAGYRSLYAQVREDNQRSAGVLLRAGFHETRREEVRDALFIHFEINL